MDNELFLSPFLLRSHTHLIQFWIHPHQINDWKYDALKVFWAADMRNKNWKEEKTPNDQMDDKSAHKWEDKQLVMFLIVEYHTHLVSATSHADETGQTRKANYRMPCWFIPFFVTVFFFPSSSHKLHYHKAVVTESLGVWKSSVLSQRWYSGWTRPH